MFVSRYWSLTGLVDPVTEGVDLLFRLGPLRDSSLVARKILIYLTFPVLLT
jgi:hypothetical protein